MIGLVTFLFLHILYVTSSEDSVDCGVIKTTIMSPLIMNATPTTSASWPWYAALYSFVNEEIWEFFCGSTIISETVVITAAHCVWNLPSDSHVQVVAGSFFNDFYRTEWEKQTVNSSKIIIHHLYRDSLGSFGSDIALIRLETPFVFSDFVQPICMNLTLRNIINHVNFDNITLEGKVAGMGITENGSISSDLRETQVQLVSTEECVNNQKVEFKKFVTISSFCGKGMNDSVVCNGDSGGGLAIRNAATGRWELEGIVSISPKHPRTVLCNPEYYTIYTKVGLFVNWIKIHLHDDK